ncbi:MAG: hypothetical protein VB092_06855 [Oscillospiraceae bacterium]|nr:hypothetical protein [Oscillospiraceae bacterium]
MERNIEDITFSYNVSESALVQLYGEKLISENDIIKTGANTEKIVGAANVIRDIYGSLFKKQNDVLVRNGYSPIEYRSNYFPHFTESTADTIIQKIASKVGIRIDTDRLPTDIAGLTQYFRPGKRWMA